MTPPVAAGPMPEAQPPASPQQVILKDLVAMLPDGSGTIDLGCTLGLTKVYVGLHEGDDARYTTGWVYLLQIGMVTLEIPEHIWLVIGYELKVAGVV